MPYMTFRFLQQLGILGYQTHKQYFKPSVDNLLRSIKDKDGLGFHDITTNLTPSPHLVNFFRSTIPAQAPEYSARFQSRGTLLRHYAVELGIEKYGWQSWAAGPG